MRLAKPLSTLSGILFYLSIALVSAHAQSGWHVERTLQIGGTGGMDYLTVDAGTHRLMFLAVLTPSSSTLFQARP